MASGSNPRVGRRKDQRLVHPAELEQLRGLAEDGQIVREALRSLGSKRLAMMQTIRDLGDAPASDPKLNFARGWIEYDSDLGDAILAAERRRGAGSV